MKKEMLEFEAKMYAVELAMVNFKKVCIDILNEKFKDGDEIKLKKPFFCYGAIYYTIAKKTSLKLIGYNLSIPFNTGDNKTELYLTDLTYEDIKCLFMSIYPDWTCMYFNKQQENG